MVKYISSAVEFVFGNIWTIVAVAVAVIVAYKVFVKKPPYWDRIVNFMKEMHSEKTPNKSWIRWMSTFVIVAAFVLGFYQQYTNGTVQETLVIGLVTIALTGKVAQKYIENKTPVESITTLKDDVVDEIVEEEIIED